MAAKKQFATVSKIIDLISADLEVLREYWRIRKNKKSKITGEDVKTFIAKLDGQIEFWQRLQILNADSPGPSGAATAKCLKCVVMKDKAKKQGQDKAVKRKDFSGQTEADEQTDLDLTLTSQLESERISSSILETEASGIQIATHSLSEAQFTVQSQGTEDPSDLLETHMTECAPNASVVLNESPTVELDYDDQLHTSTIIKDEPSTSASTSFNLQLSDESVKHSVLSQPDPEVPSTSTCDPDPEATARLRLMEKSKKKKKKKDKEKRLVEQEYNPAPDPDAEREAAIKKKKKKKKAKRKERKEQEKIKSAFVRINPSIANKVHKMTKKGLIVLHSDLVMDEIKEDEERCREYLLKSLKKKKNKKRNKEKSE